MCALYPIQLVSSDRFLHLCDASLGGTCRSTPCELSVGEQYRDTLPAVGETKRPFGITTLSSEFLAQSTMPLRPFMGKLMSVITDTAGSLWMLATAYIKRGRN